MNLNNDDPPFPLHVYPNIECKYYQTNVVLNKNVNPFNNVKNCHETREKRKPLRREDGAIINMYDYTNTTPDTQSSNINNVFSLQEINQEHFDDEHTSYKDKHTTPNKRSDKSLSQPALNLSAKSSKILDAACSRTITKSDYRNVTFNKYYDSNKLGAHSKATLNNLTRDNKYPDKSTYCRPLHNMYNEDFVFKTMQKHARLQYIVKKLVSERQKEKQREAWNNYINELKNKHRYYSNEPIRIAPQYVPNENQELIDDFWDTRFTRQESEPNQTLLNKLMGVSKNEQFYEYDSVEYSAPVTYKRNFHCYPTSSQARIIMLNRERQRNNRMSQPITKYNTFHVNRNCKPRNDVINVPKCNQSFLSPAEVQTDTRKSYTRGVITEETNPENMRLESFRNLFKNKSPEATRLKKQNLQTDGKKAMPLERIEDKLDILIKSINSVVVEMKSQSRLTKTKRPITNSRSVSCTLKDLADETLNRTKSDSYGFDKTNEVVYTSVLHNNAGKLALTDISTSTPQFQDTNSIKIEKIIQEEMEKSEKIKKDIEELLHTKCNQQCSVQIEFDIPTKEMSTAVTKSLSLTQPCLEKDLESINQTIRSGDGDDSARMTIAVNTDPLGLLALLQVSAETIKQLISYMPNLDYNSCLSLFQAPRRPCVAHYICNVCGATFNRPSQLSDHIENHCIGRRRGCCVCRHMLHLRSDRIGLFDCKYCGQKFARAYCCELHQQACAKRLGKIHNVQSNLMLLR